MATDYQLIRGLHVPAIVAGANKQLTERIAELESFDQEDRDWIRLGDQGDFEFSRPFITDILRLARIMYIRNPLIKRGVDVISDYIFSRPVTITAPDEDVQNVINAFVNDPLNQNEFTSHIARIQLERQLRTDGNLFLVLIPNAIDGHIRVTTIDADQMTDIVCDPKNRTRRWFYKREWNETTTNLETGTTETNRRTAYYRDFRYTGDVKRKSIGNDPVIDGAYIYHIKVGGFVNWKFGISEYYAAISWAKAYTRFLEDWSAIVAAYAVFAFQVTTEGGKQGVQAAKKKLETTIGVGNVRDTNPAPAPGSSFVGTSGTKLEPVRTAGATTSAEDGRRLLLQVAATFGLPETFFGNVGIGNFATAKSLDRPTELMLTNRQELWKDVYRDIIMYVLEWAARAVDGPLFPFADEEQNSYGETVLAFHDIDTTVNITFPAVVERDITEYVGAIVSGTTLDGKTPTVIPDYRIIARWVLTVLGETDIDTKINELFPTDESAKPKAPSPAPSPAQNGASDGAGGVLGGSNADPDEEPDPDTEAIEAIRTLREAIKVFADRLNGPDNVINMPIKSVHLQ